MNRKSREEGYRTILIEAHEGETLEALIALHLVRRKIHAPFFGGMIE